MISFCLSDCDRLDLQEGRALLGLARDTIGRHLGLAGVDDEALVRKIAAALTSSRFRKNRGVFVTLKSEGRLRGCIGSLRADGSTVAEVGDNAIKAAFHDPRFPPLTREELSMVRLEISVLSSLQLLRYDDVPDLLAQLQPGQDGVLITQHGPGPKILSATFLPQVWEQLSSPEHFLNHLCVKAGLPAAAWRDGHLQVETYRVQRFAE
ncbi:MAG: AmmeMemoRadiSam system protein A [Desulfobulbaceae bacterium]|nr:MAG: AmmeMemoRadiSam system protein A [Desulfobulbaceae bacterium]